MHVLDADGATVGVAQDAEDLAQLEEGLAAEASGGEGPVEVPQGQPVRGHVEVVVPALLVLQRVGVGHQVATNPVGVDQLLNSGHLVDVVVVGGVDVLGPADRFVGDPEGLEELVVEAVVAQQELVDLPQEVAALSTLDDAVVIGGREGQDLAHGVAVERHGARTLPLSWVLQGADTDDGALTLHEAGHRVDRADAARVGQRDGGAPEVFDGQLVVTCLADHLLVRGPEVDEVHLVGALDRGHHQRPAAIVLLQVDGEPEVHVGGVDEGRLAILGGEAAVHLG